MKRIISLVLALVMMATCAAFVSSCGETKEKEKSISRIVVTAGKSIENTTANVGSVFESLADTEDAVPDDMPCVELFTDENNAVVAATALNDDGAVLIIGEKLVGENADAAVEKIVSLAVTTGYIPSDDGNGGTATVSIAVSGTGALTDKLQKEAEKAASAALAAHAHVKAKVVAAKAAHLEDLRNELVLKNICTQEEAAALSEQQVYDLLKADRIETAQLYTAAMKEAYYSARDYRITLAERKETAAVINSMGGLYSLMAAGYSAALDGYGKIIDQLDAARYDFLVSPDSAYQKSIAALYEARAELVAERRVCATLTVDSEAYTVELANLRMREEEFDAALAAYIALGNQLDEALKTLIASLRSFETALEEIENKLPADITDALNAKAAEIDAHLNAVKDGFFAEFEAAHAADFATAEASLQARKEQLQQAAAVNAG